MTQTNIHHPRLFTIVFTLLWQSLVDISDAGITWWTHTLAVSSAEERLWPTQCPAPSPLSNVWLEQADTWSVGQHCSTLLHSLTDCCWQWAMFSVRRGKWCGGMRVTPWIVRSSEIVWCPGRMFKILLSSLLLTICFLTVNCCHGTYTGYDKIIRTTLARFTCMYFK